MEYRAAIYMTRPSCDDPRPARPAEGPVAEGCYCKPGFIYDPGTKQCGSFKECGCVSGTDYVPVSIV